MSIMDAFRKGETFGLSHTDTEAGTITANGTPPLATAIIHHPQDWRNLPSLVLSYYFETRVVQHWGTYAVGTNEPLEDHPIDPLDDTSCPLCISPVRGCPVNARNAHECQQRHLTTKAETWGAMECAYHDVDAVHTPEYHAEEGT